MKEAHQLQSGAPTELFHPLPMEFMSTLSMAKKKNMGLTVFIFHP